MGRIGVDLYPEQAEVRLEQVKTFAKSLGGSPTNVAVGAARLGARAAVVTKVGDDPFGRFAREALADFGVDSRWVGIDPELRTPLAFCEVHPPDHFPLLFYREPKAPDLNLLESELDREAIRSARLLWTTGTGLSAEPSRATTLAALAERDGAGDGITVHDLDYRPMFWSSLEESRRWTLEALPYATVVVGNQDEVEMAVGTRDAEQASQALLDLGAELAIVKRGPDGVLARTRNEIVDLEPVSLEVLNGLGAGDAFGGALTYALVEGWDVESALRLANGAGAIVASRLSCSEAMPTLAELWRLPGVAVPS
ncbi:MAG: 5-dehydro-2-deoxygluconokinase [Actinobacteria bacterium]|nr:5-dehydro-2-deoxygluconokinase [Actinomycetota bacterium]